MGLSEGGSLAKDLNGHMKTYGPQEMSSVVVESLLDLFILACGTVLVLIRGKFKPVVWKC